MQLYTGAQEGHRNEAEGELLKAFEPSQEALVEVDKILQDQFGVSLIDGDSDTTARSMPSKAQLLAAHPSMLWKHKQILQETANSNGGPLYFYALMFSVNALQSCADVYWNRLSSETSELMYTVLHVLRTRYTDMPKSLASSAMKLVVRLSLLYWKRLGLHRALLTECTNAIKGTESCLRTMAFYLLEELVFSALQDHPSLFERKSLRSLAIRDTIIRPALQMGVEYLQHHVPVADLEELTLERNSSHFALLRMSLFGSEGSVRNNLSSLANKIFRSAEMQKEVTGCLRLVLTCLSIDLQHVPRREQIGGHPDDSPLIPPLTWKYMMHTDKLILFLRLATAILSQMYSSMESCDKQLGFNVSSVAEQTAEPVHIALSQCLDHALQCAMQLMSVSRSLTQTDSKERKFRCSLCLGAFCVLSGSSQLQWGDGVQPVARNIWLPAGICWFFPQNVETLSRMVHKIRASFSPPDIGDSPLFKIFVKTLGMFTRFLITASVNITPQDVLGIFDNILKTLPDHRHSLRATPRPDHMFDTSQSLSGFTEAMWNLVEDDFRNRELELGQEHPFSHILGQTLMSMNPVVNVFRFWGRFVDSVCLLSPTKRASIAEEVPSVVLAFFCRKFPTFFLENSNGGYPLWPSIDGRTICGCYLDALSAGHEDSYFR
eukprot:gb/GECG01013860.1/.p1 GENE.gb/GECG01013860.1/~~gb/GECG01013860.1/.p1  ORF type:complete len:661 (+),score=53.37 gb/GECG01013860.1/:1-1983(+)